MSKRTKRRIIWSGSLFGALAVLALLLWGGTELVRGQTPLDLILQGQEAQGGQELDLKTTGDALLSKLEPLPAEDFQSSLEQFETARTTGAVREASLTLSEVAAQRDYVYSVYRKSADAHRDLGYGRQTRDMLNRMKTSAKEAALQYSNSAAGLDGVAKLFEGSTVIREYDKAEADMEEIAAQAPNTLAALQAHKLLADMVWMKEPKDKSGARTHSEAMLALATRNFALDYLDDPDVPDANQARMLMGLMIAAQRAGQVNLFNHYADRILRDCANLPEQCALAREARELYPVCPDNVDFDKVLAEYHKLRAALPAELPANLSRLAVARWRLGKTRPEEIAAIREMQAFVTEYVSGAMVAEAYMIIGDAYSASAGHREYKWAEEAYDKAVEAAPSTELRTETAFRKAAGRKWAQLPASDSMWKSVAIYEDLVARKSELSLDDRPQVELLQCYAHLGEVERALEVLMSILPNPASPGGTVIKHYVDLIAGWALVKGAGPMVQQTYAGISAAQLDTPWGKRAGLWTQSGALAASTPEEAATRVPPDCLMGIASAFEGARRYEEMERVALALASQEPIDQPFTDFLILAAAARGDTAEAARINGEIVVRGRDCNDPTSLNRKLMHPLRVRFAGDHNGALAIWQGITEQHPDSWLSAYAYLGMGTTYQYLTKDSDKAQEIYQTTIDTFPPCYAVEQSQFFLDLMRQASS